MSTRIVEITRRGSRIEVDTGRLVIESEGEKTMVPICDLEAVILAERAVSVTAAAMSDFAVAIVPVTICDARYRPCGMMLPLASSSVCDLFRRQVEMREPLRKQLWQTIVRRKIENQAQVLRVAVDDDVGLLSLSRSVMSGDVGNVEATAAQRFWLKFPGVKKRDREARDLNVLLNFGYMVIWAMTARAICGTGLNPNIGLCHHNKYNPFCLASDLMEPFRFLAERAALEQRDFDGSLTRDSKRQLLADVITGTLTIERKNMTISTALPLVASSLKKSIVSGKSQLILPEAV